MTQKEKLMRATMLAQQVKSIASRIDFDCRSYDSTWALSYARQLKEAAEEYLKLK